MYRITIFKEVLSGALAGLTVTDSYTVDETVVKWEVERLTKQEGTVRKFAVTSNAFRFAKFEVEEL